jgi:transposase
MIPLPAGVRVWRATGWPNLLAMILFEKFDQHQPVNRQNERYGRKGIELSLSTLADQVGAYTTPLQPLYGLIERHVLAAERLHAWSQASPFLSQPVLQRRIVQHRVGQ